jgi:multidrug efflux pump subunit AcrB
VNRTNTQDVIKVTRCVKDYVEKQRAKMPEGVYLATWFDLSTMVRDRINMLLRNGAQGIVLVFIALSLFLNLRLALGETINMISLFAFIMTLGILVDDAIIVGENIFTHFHKGKSPSAAVVDGLKEVGGPVVMAVSTTIVAFIPLLFIAGIMGKFIAVMPRAVIAILIISLGEALIILPAHLSGALTRSALKTDSRPSWHERIRFKVEQILNIVIEKHYTSALKYVVKNRYFAFAIGLGALIISLGIVAGGYVPFVFFPKGESDWVIAEVGYPLGTPYKVTEKTIEHLEKQAFKLNDLFNKKLKNNGDIIVNTFALPSENRRSLSVNTVLNKWRSLIGEIPGVETLTFTTFEGGPGGNPIEIQLAGKDFNQLRRAADELKIEMRTYPGTFDITDNFKPGKEEKKEEKQVKIKEGAGSLGITMSDIARQLRQAFYGEESVRIQRGRDDVKVMVRYDASDRRSIAGIEEMRIRTIDGQEIPIEEVANITHGRAYSAIHRVDRKRVITVSS